MKLYLMTFVVGVAVAACTPSSSHFEVINLVAEDDVLLIDPSSVVGGKIRLVATLPAGASISVTDCRPRKSDIDVLVKIDGKIAVAWTGKYKLVRRAARQSDEPGSTTSSCWGLLE